MTEVESSGCINKYVIKISIKYIYIQQESVYVGKLDNAKINIIILVYKGLFGII